MKQWVVKPDPLFERNIKGVSSRSILKRLDAKIARLRRDPYFGKQLRPPYTYLREIKVNHFRLYYEILERQRTILLKAFYPRRLQRKYLNFMLWGFDDFSYFFRSPYEVLVAGFSQASCRFAVGSFRGFQKVIKLVLA